MFVDNAQGIVQRVVPAPSHEELKREIVNAIAETQRWGLTGVHDPGEPQEVLDIYEELGKAGQLGSRIYAMVADDSATIARAFARGPQSGLYGGMLWIRSIKLYADGAHGLARRGAAGAVQRRPRQQRPAQVHARAPPGRRDRARSARGSRCARTPSATGATASRSTRTRRRSRRCPRRTTASASSTPRTSTIRDIPRFAKLGVIPSMQSEPPDQRHVLGRHPARRARDSRRRTRGGRSSTRAWSSPTAPTSRWSR